MREGEAKIFRPKTKLRHHSDWWHQSASKHTIIEALYGSSGDAEGRVEAIDEFTSKNRDQTSVDQLLLAKDLEILQNQKNNSTNQKISITTGRILTESAEGKTATTLKVSNNHLRTRSKVKS